jgi:hypothetical protein
MPVVFLDVKALSRALAGAFSPLPDRNFNLLQIGKPE